MGSQNFPRRSVRQGAAILPRSYRTTVRWLPRIGDIVPDFTARTTDGTLEFHRWAAGSWVLFFSHPAAFTPVCSTEMASFADARPEFDARGVKVLALSCSPAGDQAAWLEDVGRMFGVTVSFPTVEDTSGDLSALFGMTHPKDGVLGPIRKSFIIDPLLRVRMIFEYPGPVGRSTAEILRVIDALQVHDRSQVSTPSDWQPGDRCILPIGMTDAEATSLYGSAWQKICYYLKVVKLLP